jgi:UDP-N-acetylglucosamine 2-epimerase
LDPYPEEFYRTSIDHMAELLFAPTERSYERLIKEGIPAKKTALTGNTVVDALLSENLRVEDGDGLALITLHRRETLPHLPDLLISLGRFFSKVRFLRPSFMLHPNPLVERAVESVKNSLTGWRFLSPKSHGEFLRLLARTSVVFTDSGGLLEESVVLGKPVFVLRDKTERDEAVLAGAAVLIGRDPSAGEKLAKFFEGIEDLSQLRKKFREAKWIFGDGRASRRIARHIKEWLKGEC